MREGKYILIVNQYKSDNIGDNLLNYVLCATIEKQGYEVVNRGFAQTTHQIVSYRYDLDASNTLHKVVKNIIPEHLKYMVKYRKRLAMETKELDASKCVAIVIGGGQLLKKNSVFLECLNFWGLWGKTNDIPLYLYGVGVDTGMKKNELFRYKKNLNSFEYINCRDLESWRILKNSLNITEVHISPDIAFILDRHKYENCTTNESVLVMPYNYRTAVRAFGMDYIRDEYYKNILKMIADVKGEKKILLTATTSADAKECFEFRDYLNKHGIMSEIIETSTIDQLISIIVKSSCVITGRMHAMIVSKVFGIPVKPIIVSDKIKQFANEYLSGTKDIGEIRQSAKAGVLEMLKQIGE